MGHGLGGQDGNEKEGTGICWVGMAQVGGTFSRDSDTSHETESRCQSPDRNFMKGKRQVGMNLAQSMLLSSAAFAFQARGLIKELAAFRLLDIFQELSAQYRKSSLKVHVGAMARMYVGHPITGPHSK